MRKKSKRILVSIVSFFCFLSFIIIVRKFCTSRGIGTLSWQEIYHDLFFYIVSSLLFAVIIYLKNDDFGKDKNNTER